jgi:hypothetical protein
MANSYSVDPLLIVAELRAGDLLCALQAAVAGDAHWRMKAQQLLREISNARLPELLPLPIAEIQARKQALTMENHDD